MIGERLSKRKALAILSSDASSCSTYASEEILRILMLAVAINAAAGRVGLRASR
jgi:hypothetical protein